MRIMALGGKGGVKPAEVALWPGEKLEQTRRPRFVQARRCPKTSQPPMKKIESVAEMIAVAAEFRAQGKRVALVPTMGALHGGQEAMIRAAVAKADVVVVSIFLNPLQFGPNELMERYPRSPEADLALCEASGAHFVFAPPLEVMFPRGHASYVSEEATSKPLCGASRPGHFRGVTTVMAKLFNIVRPNFVYFGQKTAQRAAVVRRMADELSFAVEVIVRADRARTGRPRGRCAEPRIHNQPAAGSSCPQQSPRTGERNGRRRRAQP